jgi:Lamin Tail Domain
MKFLCSLNKISLVFCLFIVFGASILRGQVKPYDILISEIMAKPLPNQTLPNVEYIELYNRSQNTVQLKGFSIRNGSKKDIFPDKIIKPNSFLIVYNGKKGSGFGRFGDTLALENLATISDLADDFYLENSDGTVIDAIAYDKLDYRSNAKSQGGYALERVNLKNPCNFDDWRGSDDAKGGTPGKPNSVSKDYVDTPPQILYYYFNSKKTLEIEFDRALNRSLINSFFYFQKDSVSIDSMSFIPKFQLYNRLKITFKKELTDSILYRFIVKNTLKNCNLSLNMVQNDTLLLQNAAKTIDNKDTILINEILINPQVGGSRYLEIFNKSKKVIDVKDFSVSADSVLKKLTGADGYLLFPNSFLVLADNPMDVQTRYNVSHLRRFFLKYKLPAWNEKEGKIYLAFNNTILDSLKYTKSFHNPLLVNTDGVSLERINPNKPTNEKSNWQSAAATVGYGTPAYKNSQFLVDGSPSVFLASEDVFSIPKPTFSPDDDGFEDFLLLNYKLDKTGAFAKVSVFDVKGRIVKKWMDNEPLATEGDLKWDGDTDENIKAPIGIYIVYIELILPTGEVQVFKKTVSLTTRL